MLFCVLRIADHGEFARMPTSAPICDLCWCAAYRCRFTAVGVAMLRVRPGIDVIADTGPNTLPNAYMRAYMSQGEVLCQRVIIATNSFPAPLKTKICE
jgi:hypothetical protein